MLERDTAMQKSKPGRRPSAYDMGQADYSRKSEILPAQTPVASAVVDDPLERGKRLEVTVSLRDDILRHLRVRDEIDEAQFQAGRLYERYAQYSQVGSVKAMDPTKEPVDGGPGFPEPITDQQRRAVKELEAADWYLGQRWASLVRDILVSRRKFKEIAASSSERDVFYVRRQFFDCLDALAVFWQLAGRRG